MIKTETLSYQYQDEDVFSLKDISLKIRSGERISIIGESGSGKTTLLKAINGQLNYEGFIYFNNKKLKNISEQLIAGHTEIKLIDQHYALHKNISVRENINNHLRAYNYNFRKSRLKKLSQVFLLDKILDKKVEKLSGGEKQRLAIANALSTIPEVILLDEPFNNLDYHLRKRAMNFLMEEIQLYGSTAILVSHRPDEVLSFSDKILVMRKGKVIQKGYPSTIFFKPKTEYTAGLLGDYTLLQQSLPETHILNDKYFIRPIQVKFKNSKSALACKVTSCIFKGDNYKIIGRMDNEEEIQFYSPKELTVDTLVHLSIISQVL